MTAFQFPKWTNGLRTLVALAGVGGPVYLVAFFWIAGSPRATDVGYQPPQPVPYDHTVHAGELGLDCRFCHLGVEAGPRATLPPTEVCMTCHQRIHTDSVDLELVRESAETGQAIPWVRVHDLPDYTYLDHSAHVTRGIGCESCHGRVDRMPTVYQQETLSMGWCLDCHRTPEDSLRPTSEVTTLGYAPPEGVSQRSLGLRLKEANAINPSQDCSTCHR